MILPHIQVTSEPKVKLKVVNKNLSFMDQEPLEIIKEEKILPKIEREEVFNENQPKNESHLIAKEEKEAIKNNELKLNKVEIEEKAVFKEKLNPLPLIIEQEVRNDSVSISSPSQAKDTKGPLPKKELENRVSSTKEMAEMNISNKPSESLPLNEVKIAIEEPPPLLKGSNSQNEKKTSPLKDMNENIVTETPKGTEKDKIFNIPTPIEISKSLEDLKKFENDEGQDKKSQDSTFPNISTSKETTKMVKYPSNSERILLLTQPKYAYNPVPPYPQEARRKGYEGEVLLRVEVLSDGRVGQIEIRRSSGYKVLDRSAIDAVKKWRFSPGMKGEEAISLWVNIPIKFQLR